MLARSPHAPCIDREQEDVLLPHLPKRLIECSLKKCRRADWIFLREPNNGIICIVLCVMRFTDTAAAEKLVKQGGSGPYTVVYSMRNTWHSSRPAGWARSWEVFKGPGGSERDSGKAIFREDFHSLCSLVASGWPSN